MPLPRQGLVGEADNDAQMFVEYSWAAAGTAVAVVGIAVGVWLSSSRRSWVALHYTRLGNKIVARWAMGVM